MTITYEKFDVPQFKKMINDISREKQYCEAVRIGDLEKVVEALTKLLGFTDCGGVSDFSRPYVQQLRAQVKKDLDERWDGYKNLKLKEGE